MLKPCMAGDVLARVCAVYRGKIFVEGEKRWKWVRLEMLQFVG